MAGGHGAGWARTDGVWVRGGEGCLDGLVAQRPAGWLVTHGDPTWQDYLWTAMLDPLELSYGVGIDDVEATMVRGRPTWAATCRPLIGKGEDWEGGYEPRCSCCPLLDSAVSRLVECGPQDPTLSDSELPTAYRVHLDSECWACGEPPRLP
ncbi:hypothetical protein ACFOLD_09520 [Kocuria carniphila]|uniref:hypothetical protein n=1 Tax=Kocuria carniphila TaxID=262208 RepID=UPI0036231FC2